MKRIFMLLKLAAIVAGATAAFAIPQQINYQGYLTRPNGTPLDTTVAITFAIYDAPVGGAVQWTETHPSVAVYGGLFNVLLGSVNPLLDHFTFSRWLGVAVGNNTQMTPRQFMVSVPHAYRTGTVDGASGGTITGNVTVSGKGNLGWSNTNTGNWSFVTGSGNDATGAYSTIAGGRDNDALGDTSAIGGGILNVTSAGFTTIAGGRSNLASARGATIGGGQWNRARGTYSVISGGGGPVLADTNSASGDYSTIGGGSRNATPGAWAVVAGGYNNQAAGSASFVGGGFGNQANNNDGAVVAGIMNVAGYRAFVGGGELDSALGVHSVVGGGHGNAARAERSVVGGGYYNATTGAYSTVAGGALNTASGNGSAIGGGNRNFTRGLFSYVGGGGGEILADSNSASGDWSFIGGGKRSRASGHSAVVCGGSDNAASGYQSTVSGGANNLSGSNWTTIGGGLSNTASAPSATIAGGQSNSVSGNGSSLGGGYQNSIGSQSYGTIGGGFLNHVNGAYATIPGGYNNRATGSFSFAAGRNAQTNGEGVFAWADATGDTFGIGLINSFNARASNGFRFWTTSDITQNIGARLPGGSSTWTTLSDSTKKRNIRPVNTEQMLDKVSRLPIKQWSYISQDPSIEHIGPLAQDFWNLFRIGDDSLTISTIDPGGIALAAIQELAKRNEKLEEDIALLRAQVQTLIAGQQKTMTEGK